MFIITIRLNISIIFQHFVEASYIYLYYHQLYYHQLISCLASHSHSSNEIIQIFGASFLGSAANLKKKFAA